MNWNTFYMQNHGGERTNLGTSVNTSLHYRNFWNTMVGVNYSAGSMSTSTLRGGPSLQTDDQVSTWLGVATDSRKAMQLMVNANFSNRWESDAWYYNLSSNLYWRPAGRVQMSVGASYGKAEDDSQWVAKLTTGEDETEREHYVFGHIEQETISLTGRLDITFTPNLSLQLYLQPFVSAAHYGQFKQVADPRADKYAERFTDLQTEPNDWGWGYRADLHGNGLVEGQESGIPDPDFNYKQFRSNAVFRWEYRPGSALFLVWSQGRNHSDQAGQLDFGSDFGTLFDAPADDVIMVKASYWF